VRPEAQEQAHAAAHARAEESRALLGFSRESRDAQPIYAAKHLHHGFSWAELPPQASGLAGSARKQHDSHSQQVIAPSLQWEKQPSLVAYRANHSLAAVDKAAATPFAIASAVE